MPNGEAFAARRRLVPGSSSMSDSLRRTRTAYHHGDLRRALLEAGVELARRGGPDAIVLREAARMVGVAPNSAYSHFATLVALKAAVAQEALKVMAEAMAAHVASVAEPEDPGQAAAFHVGEVGRAYVLFALAEPGLFKAAMDANPAGVGTPGQDKGPDSPADGRPKPDTLLIDALQRLVEVGRLAPQDVGAAVMASWATVHGLATILLDLQPTRTTAERDAAIDAGLHYLLAGLAAG
jgi:AcrR family transcriptional regulator